MNAERLLEHFEKIADAPDAIARLRRFVLDLAVRGKLVPQEADDEPASELLKRIAKEKARLVRAGEIPKYKESQPPSLDDLSFGIPPCWQPVKIEHVLDELQTGPFGSSLHQSDYRVGGTPVINPASLQNEQIVPIANMAVDATTLERLASFKLCAGDIVMARRGEMGRCAVVSDREAGWLCGTGSLILRPSKLAYPRFLVTLIGSPFGREYLGGSAVGATMHNLNQSILLNLPFGLPPLAEQHRIVATVDELMALCDRLEVALVGREATRDRLAAASLARLNAADPNTFHDDARFALDALPALTTRVHQFKQLRQTILNLAMRGKLVPQEPVDKPAEDVLSRATSAKGILRRERQIGRDEDPEFSQSAGEASAPKHWAWAHLSNFALVLGGKRLPAGAEFSTTPTDHIYIRVTDMKGGTISTENVRYISPEVQSKIAKYTIDSDDIYITIAGTIGEIGEVPSFFHGHNLTENAAKIVFREIDRAFLIMALRSKDVQAQFAEKTKQMAQPKLALKRILGARVPIPPLAEQRRIVAKIDELMALCDRLEANLTTANETRRRLLEALLAEALAPAEERELEAAE